MKAIYLDGFAGISGNMLLGALIGAGVPIKYLQEELGKLPISEEYQLKMEQVKKQGIQANHIKIILNDEVAAFQEQLPLMYENKDGHCCGKHEDHSVHEKHCCGSHEQGPEEERENQDSHSCGSHEHHQHGHENHCCGKHKPQDGHVHEDCSHAQEEKSAHLKEKAHAHRSWKMIRAMIDGSALSEKVKQKSLAVFEHLAEAEGKVHGMPKDEVAFHEVGATDSIVDIVGAAICLDYLEVERIYASELNLGRGFVHCAHGLMPVPTPAVAELLKGWPTVQKVADTELTTPTGAAFIRALARKSAGLPQGFLADRISYGAGTKDLPLPNVLRLYIGVMEQEAQGGLCILETNIDDMSPQIFGYLYDKLFEEGAVDLWTEAIQMKKNRPAHKLSVLVDAKSKEACLALIFRETSTLGIRVLPLTARVEAARRMAKSETRYGDISCKIGAYKGEIVTIAPEYEDCKKAAGDHRVPLKQVQQEALRELQKRLGY